MKVVKWSARVLTQKREFIKRSVEYFRKHKSLKGFHVNRRLYKELSRRSQGAQPSLEQRGAKDIGRSEKEALEIADSTLRPEIQADIWGPREEIEGISGADEA